MKLKEISLLQRRLKATLPGWDAQRILSPFNSDRYIAKVDNAKQAGVMALMYPDQNENLDLIFIKRPSNNPMDKHGGQVSFPGGQAESNDKNIKQTALRETFEEVGVNPDKIKILGSLSPLFVFVLNFMVYPSIGFIEEKPEFIIQESEVDFVITESVSKLLLPETIKTTNLNVRGNILKNIPYFDLNGEILWGATAMITSELVEIIKELK